MFTMKNSGDKPLMTLDEAIEHCREKEDCSLCGQEHKQLREWLEDYKRLLQEKSEIQLLGAVSNDKDERPFDPIWGMYLDEFEDFTEDEQNAYESVLDEQYKDTGVNINDIM